MSEERPVWDELPMRAFVDYLAEGADQTLTWGGRFCWKNPLDLVIYQEIVQEVKPTMVIETGSKAGGSAIFWRDMLYLAGQLDDYSVTRVISVDVNPVDPVAAVDFITGSSTAEGVVEAIRREVEGHVVLVNLDSDHAYKHVTAELNVYAPMVTPGSYLIVEDGIDDYRFNRQGPRAAVLDWLPGHPEFEIDKNRERLGITNCPDGFLRRL